MDWQILGAIGIGTIIATAMQLGGQVAIERFRADREFKAWLRNKKMETYEEILYTLLFIDSTEISEETGKKFLAGVNLICDDSTLPKRILAHLHEETTEANKSEREDERVALVDLLKEDLHKTR